MKYNLLLIEKEGYSNLAIKTITNFLISKGYKVSFRENLEATTEKEYSQADCIITHPNSSDYAKLYTLKNKYPNVGLIISPGKFGEVSPPLLKDHLYEYIREKIEIMEDGFGVVILEKPYFFEELLQAIEKAIENSRGVKK